MRRGFLFVLCCVLTAVAPGASGGDAATDETPSKLVWELVRAMKLPEKDCPRPLTRGLAADRVAVCADAPDGHEAVMLALDGALATPAFAGRDVLRVIGFEEHNGTYHRSAFWIGSSTLEIVTRMDSPLTAVIASRSYPRCGDDVPFMPRVYADGDRTTPAPLFIDPDSYPDRAARELRDGAVALSVQFDEEGTPDVTCIHHATPAGYGFELPAIEAARLLDAGESMRDKPVEERLVTIVVQFTKADEREVTRGHDHHGH